MESLITHTMKVKKAHAQEKMRATGSKWEWETGISTALPSALLQKAHSYSVAKRKQEVQDVKSFN